MTPARSHAHGLASPSLSQLSLTALLCAFAELVFHVAALSGMPVRRRSDDWHIGDTPAVLPLAAGDTNLKELDPGPPGSRPAHAPKAHTHPTSVTLAAVQRLPGRSPAVPAPDNRTPSAPA